MAYPVMNPEPCICVPLGLKKRAAQVDQGMRISLYTMGVCSGVSLGSRESPGMVAQKPRPETS